MFANFGSPETQLLKLTVGTYSVFCLSVVLYWKEKFYKTKIWLVVKTQSRVFSSSTTFLASILLGNPSQLKPFLRKKALLYSTS